MDIRNIRGGIQDSREVRLGEAAADWICSRMRRDSSTGEKCSQHSLCHLFPVMHVKMMDSVCLLLRSGNTT